MMMMMGNKTATTAAAASNNKNHNSSDEDFSRHHHDHDDHSEESSPSESKSSKSALKFHHHHHSNNNQQAHEDDDQFDELVASTKAKFAATKKQVSQTAASETASSGSSNDGNSDSECRRDATADESDSAASGNSVAFVEALLRKHMMTKKEETKEKTDSKLLPNGGTALDEQFQDVADMLASDPEMAERIAAVFRHYECVEMPRSITEDVCEYSRRTTQVFVSKPPKKSSFESPATTSPAVTATSTTMMAIDEEELLNAADPAQPFYVVDLGQIVLQMAKFRKNLPGVQVHYAVKCNNSECILAMIAAMGGSFDCASLPEIQQCLVPGFARTALVDRTAGKNSQTEPRAARIIYANPCKPAFHMQQAERLGVQRVTFDNQDELTKIREHMPSAEAVLRIKTEDGSAVCQFSNKFGCPRSEARDLLSFAKEIGVNVVGVSFHVGSGNSDPRAYHIALRDARALFDYGESIGFHMTLVDLGGGWAGTDPDMPATTQQQQSDHHQDVQQPPRELSFEELTAAIRPVLYELFPLEHGYDIIAEPGRFFGASSHVLALNVHSKRRVQHPDGTVEQQYYLTDGMYQSFNCIYFDHAVPRLYPLDERKSDAAAAASSASAASGAAASASNTNEDSDSDNGNNANAGNGNLRLTTLWGPTCDSMDFIFKKKMFPELKVGDWLFVPEFGAYTKAAGSSFNGYSTRRVEYVSSLPSGFIPCA